MRYGNCCPEDFTEYQFIKNLVRLVIIVVYWLPLERLLSFWFKNKHAKGEEVFVDIQVWSDFCGRQCVREQLAYIGATGTRK